MNDSLFESFFKAEKLIESLATAFNDVKVCYILSFLINIKLNSIDFWSVRLSKQVI